MKLAVLGCFFVCFLVSLAFGNLKRRWRLLWSPVSLTNSKEQLGLLIFFEKYYLIYGFIFNVGNTTVSKRLDCCSAWLRILPRIVWFLNSWEWSTVPEAIGPEWISFHPQHKGAALWRNNEWLRRNPSQRTSHVSHFLNALNSNCWLFDSQIRIVYLDYSNDQHLS